MGDQYSLLVIREIAYGYRRFTDLLEMISCSRDVLAARLRQLEGLGIIERLRYPERPRHARTVCAACGREAEPGELRIIGGTNAVMGAPW